LRASGEEMLMAENNEEILSMLMSEISNVHRKIELLEHSVDAFSKTVQENNRMLSSLMSTLEQMGMLSQPYVKSAGKGEKSSDRAYY
jgi:septal ring factor EnvC (AmiA/AmiB activator)